jgi:anti-sigma factor ChrR (cupin superfamily)
LSNVHFPKSSNDNPRWVLSDLPNVNLEALEFRHFRQGIQRANVYLDPATSASTAFLRYQPGATVPLHRHIGYEHIWVLSGSQADDDGVYPTGSVLIHGPGSQHRVWSDEGCLVLAIWERGVEFI